MVFQGQSDQQRHPGLDQRPIVVGLLPTPMGLRPNQKVTSCPRGCEETFLFHEFYECYFILEFIGATRQSPAGGTSPNGGRVCTQT